MPWLDLVPKDDFDLARVLAALIEQRLQDAIDGKRELRAERTDVVH